MKNDNNDIISLAKPLELLNIHFFGHAIIDQNNSFSGLCSNPAFLECYMQKKYYNADVHIADADETPPFIIWDNIELKGLGEAMLDDSRQFGYRNDFTIVEKEEDKVHYFHFATKNSNPLMNENYISQLDLLNCFVSNYLDKVKKSKALTASYQCATIEEPATSFVFHDHTTENTKKRQAFLSELVSAPKDKTVLIHKITKQPVALSSQLSNCMRLLLSGLTAKQIAMQLSISYRTVEHHIEKLRDILGASNSKDLITSYSKQY